MRTIPALIVSGFLGAGKTTLVGHLLRQAQADGVRLAIISNEFGDTGIDKALLDQGVEGLVELDGGCVCCRLSDALGETLEMLLTQVKPDRLVLETSGVALPGEVLVQFWRPPINELISDEVVAVVVDAARFADGMAEDQTFLDQVESADIIVLNKCDLADETVLVAAEKRLAELSGGRTILRAVQSLVPSEALFPPDTKDERADRRDEDAQMRPHSHERFVTVQLEFPGTVDPAAVIAEVATHESLRSKGFIRTADGVRSLQGVGHRIEIAVPSATFIPDELVGTVVVIKRDESEHPHGH